MDRGAWWDTVHGVEESDEDICLCGAGSAGRGSEGGGGTASLAQPARGWKGGGAPSQTLKASESGAGSQRCRRRPRLLPCEMGTGAAINFFRGLFTAFEVQGNHEGWCSNPGMVVVEVGVRWSQGHLKGCSGPACSRVAVLCCAYLSVMCDSLPPHGL